MNGKLWNEYEDKILYENYGKTSVKQINKMLPNRTYRAIVSRASLIGLNHNGNRKNINVTRHCQLCGEALEMVYSPRRWICNNYDCLRIYEKYRWDTKSNDWVCYEYADSAC